MVPSVPKNVTILFTISLNFVDCKNVHASLLSLFSFCITLLLVYLPLGPDKIF